MPHSAFIAALLLATSLGGQVPSPADPQPAAAGQAPATRRVSPDYVIGAQDVLKVIVFDEPQLSGTFRVDADGAIFYPFVGRVPAAGQTLRTVEARLTELLADGYVKRPQVAIEVEQYRSRSIFVVGEVRAPGKYALSGEITLLEALAQAGSTTATASSEVLILRAASTSEQALAPEGEGIAETLRVSLADLQSGKLSANVRLREGDTIFVAKAEKFYVTGHARNPGAYAWERGITVLQAISLAGGVSDRGSNRRIRIVRVVNGQKTDVGARLTDLVQPNDTIVIRQRLL